MKKHSISTLVLISFASLACAGLVKADEPILSADHREVPGATPSRYIYFNSPGALQVEISGSYDQWATRTPLKRHERIWQLDLKPMNLQPGRYGFKFIVDGVWESGANRSLFISPEGLAERPPELVRKATLIRPDRVQIDFSGPIPPQKTIQASLSPPVPIERQGFARRPSDGYAAGYQIEASAVHFMFNPDLYRVQLKPHSVVTVAGSFNGWDPDGKDPRWRLRPGGPEGFWTTAVPSLFFKKSMEKEPLDFKFVVDGTQWLEPPHSAPNRRLDDQKLATNLRIESLEPGYQTYLVQTAEAIPVDQPVEVLVAGLWKRPLRTLLDPVSALDLLSVDGPLGVSRRDHPRTATYRVFSPRANQVELLLYDAKQEAGPTAAATPAEAFPMWKDPESGAWELSLMGWDLGRRYAFRVSGPEGLGEGFGKDQIVGDPYATAATRAEELPLLLETDRTNRWFSGWTDQDWETPDAEDLVIYEAHVRDLTSHPTATVPPPYKGLYEGVVQSLGTATGAGHIQSLGANAIEFMPVQEFNNEPGSHNWGYTTVYYFSPESSYAQDAAAASHVYEFKRMVNELHSQGIAVLIDVVYNHVGWPNLFASLDRKYYFRLNPDYSYQNFSGVGNDVRSEAPLMRRLILESVLYWMEEYHVDGFRFDLAELIDLDTLWAIRDEARKLNPKVILISEPWSFRGTHKYDLTGQGWSAWNNDFRYGIKDFVRGWTDQERIQKIMEGSVSLWTANPLQSVNYVESHDDMALVDELSDRPDKDGYFLSQKDAQMNRLAATCLLTSLGIPMIHAGQEYLRSKRGVSNTYNRGDELNAMNWDDLDRLGAKETLEYYRGLVAIRNAESGRSFRVRDLPEKYHDWILPPDRPHALGFVINARGQHPGDPFLVLLNAHEDSTEFRMTLPPGTWQQVADGNRAHPDGLAGVSFSIPLGDRPVTLSVPGRSAEMYRLIP